MSGNLIKFSQHKSKSEYPELIWPGKRPFTSMEFHPAHCCEVHGNSANGWMNRIYLGDNLHVMGNLLSEFRGKINLIYIDPPFNSMSDYTKKITVQDRENNAINEIKEKQYSDIWKNGEYLQFMYERLILIRELLAETGSIYVHCDWHQGHHIRLLMDEVFGPENFRNEIAWCYLVNKGRFMNKYPPRHDTILFYAKTAANYFNRESIRMEPSAETLKRWRPYANKNGEVPYGKLTPGMKRVAGKGEKPYILRGGIQVDWITSIPGINSGHSKENSGYPTQKPERLIETFIKASSKPGDLVFDCFMGSGTTQAVAMKLGRRFIGADINPCAVQTTATRLLKTAKTIHSKPSNDPIYSGFEIYNTAKVQANQAEADITINKNLLIINNYSPKPLLNKLDIKSAEKIEWRSLVESIMIDFNYDGCVIRPTEIDIPGKKELVKGIYKIPECTKILLMKITGLLSESLEMEIRL